MVDDIPCRKTTLSSVVRHTVTLYLMPSWRPTFEGRSAHSGLQANASTDKHHHGNKDSRLGRMHARQYITNCENERDITNNGLELRCRRVCTERNRSSPYEKRRMLFQSNVEVKISQSLSARFAEACTCVFERFVSTSSAPLHQPPVQRNCNSTHNTDKHPLRKGAGNFRSWTMMQLARILENPTA